MATGINEGTQTFFQTDSVGTLIVPYWKLDVGAAGASSPFTGTFKGGTINNGTISMTTGTIAVGTVDAISQLPPNSWGTVVTTGTNTLGTIKPLIAGSQIFVTDLIISVGSATNVEIGNGGTSKNIAGTFYFNANGGLIANFRTPISTTAGSDLVFKQSSAISPLTISAQGFVR